MLQPNTKGRTWESRRLWIRIRTLLYLRLMLIRSWGAKRAYWRIRLKSSKNIRMILVELIAIKGPYRSWSSPNSLTTISLNLKMAKYQRSNSRMQSRMYWLWSKISTISWTKIIQSDPSVAPSTSPSSTLPKWADQCKLSTWPQSWVDCPVWYTTSTSFWSRARRTRKRRKRKWRMRESLIRRRRIDMLHNRLIRVSHENLLIDILGVL